MYDLFSPVAFIVGLAIATLILLLIREIVMWYWKINKLVSQNEEIISLLSNIEGELRVSSMIRSKVNAPPPPIAGE